MVHSLSKLFGLHCKLCHLWKHARSHFPDRINKRASSLFALVHYDILGPSLHTSILESKYFVAFIDGFLSKLLSVFEQFYHEDKTQFEVSIQYLRSDTAKEYLYHQFQNFMAFNGILHQTSCADTPQQNGVAKHKKWHLIETTRALLLHSNVPYHFWGMLF